MSPEARQTYARARFLALQAACAAGAPLTGPAIRRVLEPVVPALTVCKAVETFARHAPSLALDMLGDLLTTLAATPAAQGPSSWPRRGWPRRAARRAR